MQLRWVCNRQSGVFFPVLAVEDFEWKERRFQLGGLELHDFVPLETPSVDWAVLRPQFRKLLGLPTD